MDLRGSHAHTVTTAIAASRLTAAEWALIGVGVGALLGVLTALLVEWRRDRSARKRALCSLAAEWDALAVMEANDLKKRKAGGVNIDLGFTPIPTDGYRVAFPYLARFKESTRQVLVQCAFEVSAYNASATFFNTNYGQPGEDHLQRVYDMGDAAIGRAGEAIAELRKAVPRLKRWVPEMVRPKEADTPGG